MSNRTETFVLPVLSQEFENGPVAITRADGTYVIGYDFELETGEYGWKSIEFDGVVAVAYTRHEFCTESQVEAYDRMLEASTSPWLSDLERMRSVSGPRLKHFAIYFDECGCFEVAGTMARQQDSFSTAAVRGPRD